MKLLWAAAVITVVALTVSAASDSIAFQGEGLGVTLSTAKAFYTPGEPIPLKITLFNRAEDERVLHFSTSQRYDFVVETAEGGREVWRWSQGRMFLQVLGEERLGPKKPSISYTAEIPDGLKAGSYIITGVITSTGGSLSASVPVEVR